MQSISRGVAIAAIIVGVLSVIGWIFDIEFLKDVYAELPATRMNEGFSMILAGLSLWMAGGKPQRWERLFSVFAAGAVLTIGIVTLAEHIGSTSFGIDQLFYHSNALGIQPFAQRMTPPSALGFSFIGLGLVLLNLGKAVYSAQFIGSLASLIGQFALTGYAFATSTLYSSKTYGGMSVPVATLLAVLGFAVLCADPDRGFMAVLSGPNVGGIVARRLLPLGLGFLPLLTILSRIIQFLGLAKFEFGAPIILLLVILLFSVPVLWTSRLLYRTDNQRREAEQRLAGQYAIIEQLNRDLQHHAEQLEAANKELESFSYSVSHDLRAPLRHIGGFVQLLEKHMEADLNEQNKRYLSVIAASAKEMGTLIDDLLSFSRMGRAEMLTRPIELERLVHEVKRELAQSADGRAIEWSIGRLPVISGDTSMIRLVLVNYLSNALKFTQTRSIARIEIGAIVNDADVTIFVKDNGVGFDMKYANKLFGVFQRLHRADEFEGTGIGLANVRRIVQRHGGRTWAESTLDQGASFYFSLPKLEQEQPNESVTADSAR